MAADFLPELRESLTARPKRCMPIQKETAGVHADVCWESEAPPTRLGNLRSGAGCGWGRGWGPVGGGADLGYRLCKSSPAPRRQWWWLLPVAPVLLALDLVGMAGPQEFLSGKLRLCFTPPARTSLLLLRFNDAALRALQECQRQQVRPTPGSIFSSPYPSGPRAPAGDPGEGTWGWRTAFSGSGLPTSPSEAHEAGPS